ncbi:MAG: 1-deoxy-D-xylulose-5-phosphate synthase [Clostridia bacterium]|nr:1-deoxy-D-xylulose-5-phosphate synthase [Clostridia bacterium]
MDIRYLDKITGPDDIKSLGEDELYSLADEIRKVLIKTVSVTGGHLASNLGTVELTIAMHRVFNSPKDHFVWDVGHQVYTHKLLTGRYDKFDTLRQNGGLSGFPNPEESIHDVFAAGHSGTSVSAAYGLSVAETINNKKSFTVAVIGDGSFTGGLVYEALNNAGGKDTNLIVILNDNEMSISPNVGSMAMYLAAARTNPVYYRFKEGVSDILESIPDGGKIYRFVKHTKKAAKNLLYQSNFFEDLGFSYMGPIDGHNIKALEKALESAKEFDTPVLLHVRTIKGKGYSFAENNPSVFHGISKFDIDTGEPLKKSGDKNYSDTFGDILCSLAEKNGKICAITAAMALGTGLEGFSKKFPQRFFDVGIAEEHAVTFAGGLAAGSMIPVFAVYSTFLQRSYDEIVHDVAMQNKKVILAVDRAGFVGEDGRSHQGLLDVPFLKSIPGSVIYSPSSYEEMKIDFELAVDGEDSIVAVRYPRGCEGYLPAKYEATDKTYSVYGKKSSTVAIITYGSLFSQSALALKKLSEYDIDVKIIKLNRIWPIDKKIVNELKKVDTAIFFEEGMKSGGIGESFASLILESGLELSYSHIAVENTFVHHAPIPVLLSEFGLSADKQVEEVLRRV